MNVTISNNFYENKNEIKNDTTPLEPVAARTNIPSGAKKALNEEFSALLKEKRNQPTQEELSYEPDNETMDEDLDMFIEDDGQEEQTENNVLQREGEEDDN